MHIERLVRGIAIDLLMLSGGGSLFGQTNFWEKTNGPYGGDIHSLAFNPSGRLFAGTNAGWIYCSTDNGSSSMQLKAGSTNSIVYALAVNSGGDVFASIDRGESDERGFFRSTDGGQEWTRASTALPYMFSLAIDSSGHIFAGTERDAIYRSILLTCRHRPLCDGGCRQAKPDGHEMNNLGILLKRQL